MSDFNPETDLEISRLLNAPRELVWRCWTEAEHLKPWFCPKPYETIEAHIELKPGGRFFTHMVGPDGFDEASEGAVLFVDPGRCLVWTDALAAGFRPKAEPFMTGIILLSDEDGQTRYIARALHADKQTRDRHDDMGFTEGWSTVATQLEAYAPTLAERITS